MIVRLQHTVSIEIDECYFCTAFFYLLNGPYKIISFYEVKLIFVEIEVKETIPIEVKENVNKQNLRTNKNTKSAR